MRKFIYIFLLSVLFSAIGYGQQINRLSSRCPSPNQSTYSQVLAQGTGDIIYTPCTTKKSIFTGNVDFTGATVTGLGTAIGGTVSGGTDGSLLFINPANTLAQDNTNLYWDNTNKKFAINSEAAFKTGSSSSADLIIGKVAQSTFTNGIYLSHKSAVNGYQHFNNIYEYQGTVAGGSGFGYRGTMSNTGTDTTATMYGIRQDVNAVTSSNFVYGVYSSLKTQSGGNITTARAFQGVLSRVNGAGVMTEATLFNGLVASGDFTNLYGFKLQGWTAGLTTNSYGIYADATIDVGSSSRYFIYSLSTSPSFFTGKITFDATVTPSGTTGNQTINKPSGTVNVAAGSGSVIVTNSFVTANSIINVVARTNDATCSVKNYVASAGSFTINLTANCTAETSIGFIVYNS